MIERIAIVYGAAACLSRYYGREGETRMEKEQEKREQERNQK